MEVINAPQVNGLVQVMDQHPKAEYMASNTWARCTGCFESFDAQALGLEATHQRHLAQKILEAGYVNPAVDLKDHPAYAEGYSAAVGDCES